MEQNTDGEQMSPRQSTRGFKTNIKGKYEIFGALRTTDEITERYVRKKIGIRYI